MWGIAGNLDAKMIDSIAQYYAVAAARAGRPGDPALIATGKELFETGVPDRSIPPCASCHGAKAEGVADFPRLAGQHAKYVVRQIEYIQAARAQGARDARHRQGSHARRDGGDRRLRAVDLAFGAHPAVWREAHNTPICRVIFGWA